MRRAEPLSHESATGPTAYYSDEHRCWYVPVSGELLERGESVEPCRVELRDGQLWITRLASDEERPAS